MIPKAGIWRSRPYRMYVASQECFGCGIEGYSQAAHENSGKGMGLKASDDRLFPLCCSRLLMMGCHMQHDLCFDMSREDRDADARRYVEKMQARARADGWKLPMPAASGSPQVLEPDEQKETT